MLRRVLFLGILGAATCLSSVPAGSRSLPVQRLRGGGEFRFVDVGVANDETLRNEPFSQSVSSSEESAGSYGSSDTSSLFSPEWSALREDMTEFMEKRDAAAAMHLRGGSTLTADSVKVPAGKVLVTMSMSAHHIHPLNSPPVKIVVAGDCEELGNWDITKGVELKSQQSDTDTFNAQTDGMFPMHSGQVMLPAGKEVKMKYAVTKVEPGGGGVQTQWESVERTVKVPASGILELKNEFMEGRDTDPRITDEPFQCNAQEWMRYYKHHISGLSEVQPGREG